jgi:recombination protein RecA
MAKTLRAKGRKDLVGAIVGSLERSRPKTGELMWEVSRSSKEILSKVHYKLTTGIDSLDVALGGGLPFGRVVELYGLESCGKTAMVTHCAGRLQGRHIIQRKQVGHPGDKDFSVAWEPVPKDVEVTTLYIDNEQSLEEDEKLVVDGNIIDVAVARADTVDQMFKMIDVAINAIDRVSTKEHPVFILVIVDTIGGTSSREEMKAKWEDQDFPRQPKMLRRGFRRMMRKLSQRNVLAIFTNQVNARYEANRRRGGGALPQDDDFDSPGGRALKFFASVRIFMYQVNAHYKLHKDQQFPVGFCSGFVTVKNRLAKPMRAGRFVLLYDRGLNNLYSLLETLIFLKLAKSGKKEEGDAGSVSFRFQHFGIKPTTFGEDETRADPRLDSRAQWPAFHEAHKADLDLLWEKACTILFAVEGEVGLVDAVEGGTDEDLTPIEDEDEKSP